MSVPFSLVRSKAPWVPPVHTVASRRVPIVGPRATDRLHRAPGYPRASDRSCPFESRQKIPAALGMGAVATRVCCCCCRDFAEISAERKQMLPHGSDCCRPNFWDVKTRENKRFCVVSFFWGRQKLEQIRRARAHLSIVELHFRSILARVGSHLHPI